MKTIVKWMPIASFAVTLALSVDHQARLWAQDAYSDRIGVQGQMRLPPPARQDTDRDVESPRPAPQSSGRPYLGITFDPRYPDGAVARSVVPGGPADQAGIQPGDMIEAINDYRVSSYRDAYEIVDRLQPGEIIDIDFSRRITGRTQAVLGGNLMDESSAGAYAEETSARAYPERPASAFVEEPLPDPTFDLPAGRSDNLQFNGASTVNELNYDGADNRRVERSPEPRPIERSRIRERRFPRTPLLPWRRN